MIDFCVPGKPLPQSRPQVFKTGVRTDRTPSLTAFKQELAIRAAHAMQARKTPLFECSLAMRISFIMPRPKSWPKSAPVERCNHHYRPDLDNLVKSVKDALQGIVWKDDSQVFWLLATKHYAAKDEKPHTRIRIDPAIPPPFLPGELQ